MMNGEKLRKDRGRVMITRNPIKELNRSFIDKLSKLQSKPTPCHPATNLAFDIGAKKKTHMYVVKI